MQSLGIGSNGSDLTVVGEIAAVARNGRTAEASAAEALIAGYAGGPIGSWVDGSVALAHAGSAELQVLPDLALVIDGRIDNRPELASRVDLPPTVAMTRLLAECWRRAGPDMLDWVVGELAGVIVERQTGRMHALRDLGASRPLHVASSGQGPIVASEWQPLATAIRTSRRPNPEWFAAAFVGHAFNAGAVPCEGVEMVLPGHVASPKGSGWLQRRYADWHVPTLRDRRPGAYADQFRKLFDEAVRCRVEGQAKAAVCLSGGLDSTSIMATLPAVRPDAERTALCMPMRDPAGDERDLQTLVAKQVNSAIHWVDYEYGGPFGSRGPENLFERLGAPPLVTNWFLGDAMAQAARDVGLRLVLDGEDGDGSLGGSPAFLADLLVTGRWRRWLREVNAYRATGRWSGKELLELSLFAAAPPIARSAFIRRRGPLSPGVLAGSLRRSVDLENRLQDTYLLRSWSAGRFFRLAQGEVGKPEQMGPIFPAASDPWRRRGICLTHPWSDRRLMSFCMGLPYEHVAQPGGLTKLVLRQAMAGRLPREVRERLGKANLSEAARGAAFGRDAAHVRRGLQLAKRQGDWFDPAEVASIEATFDAGDGEPNAIRVAMFAWWLRWCESGETAEAAAPLAVVA